VECDESRCPGREGAKKGGGKVHQKRGSHDTLTLFLVKIKVTCIKGLQKEKGREIKGGLNQTALRGSGGTTSTSCPIKVIQRWWGGGEVK